MFKYCPYKSAKPDKKYYIFTDNNQKVHFCAARTSEFTIHKDEPRKRRCIDGHKKYENWTKSRKDTAGFWSRWLLWNKPPIKKVILILRNQKLFSLYIHNDKRKKYYLPYNTKKLICVLMINYMNIFNLITNEM